MTEPGKMAQIKIFAVQVMGMNDIGPMQREI
jgi:hypothetical protein